MKNNLIKRITAIMLSLAVFALFPAAFTQEAQAASGKKFYVCTQSTTVYNYGDGSDTYTTTYTYSKNGLMKTAKYSDGETAKYTRDKKGYVTKITRYNSAGALVSTTTFKNKYNKKKLLTSQQAYITSDGSTRLSYTSTYTYYKNKKIKKEVLKYASGGSDTYNYYKNGNIKSSVYVSADGSTSSAKYDKKGNCKSYTSKNWSENHSVLKYDKKGNLIKDVYTETETYDGKTDTTKYELSTTYKYDKHKNIIKSVTTRKVTHPDGTVSNITTTYTAKWKAVKVPKKFRHFFNN